MKRYLATAKMCLIEKSYFGLSDIAGQYAMKAAALGALLLIWKSLFTQGADMEGLTLNQMYVYTILSTMLEPLLNVRTPASSWLHDGTMLSLYMRPTSIFGQLIANTIGSWAMPLGLLAAPVAIISVLCGVDMRPVNPWFFPSILLAISEGFAVDFLFTCLMIRLRNLEWPVFSLRNALTALFTGSLIPFTVLPWGIGRFLELTPLGTLAGAPLALYSGLGDAKTLITAQVVWNIVLWPLAVYLFTKSRERMVSFGG